MRCLPLGLVFLVLATPSGLAWSDETRTFISLPLQEKTLERHFERRFPTEILRYSEPRRLGRDQLRDLPPAVEAQNDRDIQRRILADGTFETRYPDGFIRRQRPDGSIETVTPDGTVTMALPIQTPGAELPLLPDALDGWGSQLGEQLLGLLRNVLSDAEFDAYRQTEASKGYYELIDWRLRSLNFLTASR